MVAKDDEGVEYETGLPGLIVRHVVTRMRRARGRKDELRRGCEFVAEPL